MLEIKDFEQQKNYEQLLVDIQNLPYCLSQTAVNKVFESIYEDEFLSTKDYFRSLEETKDKWCAAFRKDRFTLRTRSTQRVENTNKLLKNKLSSQITLNELFVRLFSMHLDLNNHDLDNNELTQIAKANNLLSKSPILESIQDKVSVYVYKLTVLNLANALSWKVSNKPLYFKVYIDDEENFTKVTKKGNLLICSCYFSTSMGLPCEHILSCLVHSTDTVTNRQYMQAIMNHFDERWYQNEEESLKFYDSEILEFIIQYNFLKNSKKKPLKTVSQLSSEKAEKKSVVNDVKDENDEKNRLDFNNEHLSVEEKLNELSLHEEAQYMHQNKKQMQIKIERKSLQPSTTTNPNLLLNPFEVKTVGRPPEVKRIPSYFEKTYATKRKPQGELPRDDLKKIKSLPNTSFK